MSDLCPCKCGQFTYLYGIPFPVSVPVDGKIHGSAWCEVLSETMEHEGKVGLLEDAPTLALTDGSGK